MMILYWLRTMETGSCLLDLRKIVRLQLNSLKRRDIFVPAAMWTESSAPPRCSEGVNYRRLSSFTVTFHQEFHPGADRADLHQSNIRMSPRVGAPVDLQLESNNHPELIITSSLPPPVRAPPPIGVL